MGKLWKEKFSFDIQNIAQDMQRFFWLFDFPGPDNLIYSAYKYKFWFFIKVIVA